MAEHSWWQKAFIRGLQDSIIVSVGCYFGLKVSEPNRGMVAATAIGCACVAAVILTVWAGIEAWRGRNDGGR